MAFYARVLRSSLVPFLVIGEADASYSSGETPMYLAKRARTRDGHLDLEGGRDRYPSLTVALLPTLVAWAKVPL